MESWGLLTLKWTIRDSEQPTQDDVLGNSQPSLRDYSLAHANPGLTSWAILSRPSGTNLERVVLTHLLKSGPTQKDACTLRFG